MPSTTERLQAAAKSWLATAVKDIWGQDYRNFMGISSPNSAGSGDVIQDNPTGYTQAYTAESYVYRAVTVRGNGIAQAPLRCYAVGRDGKLGDSVEHDALAVLESTNPIVGTVRGCANLMRYTLGSQDLHGHTAWELAFNRRGTMPTEIYWQPPTTYSVKRDPVLNFGGIQKGSRPDEVIPPQKLVYLTTPNFGDPLIGTSKIKVLRSAINLRRAGVASNQSFFDNSMRPDWILSGTFLNTEENIARIRRALRKWLTGANNRSPLILGEGAKASLLTMSAKDAEWIQQQRMNGEEITMVFGVSVIYLNNLERATYENIGAAKTMLWHDGIIPDADPLAASITRDFLWRFWPETVGKMALAFDYSEVEGLGEDVSRKYERVMAAVKEMRESAIAGLATAAQVRPIFEQLLKDLGLPSDGFRGEVPGGDHILAPYTDIPKGQHGTQALIDIFAVRGANPIAPYVVENVPGAPTVGNSADQAQAEQAAKDEQARQDAQAQAQAAKQPGGPGNQPPPKGVDLTEIAEVIRLVVREEVKAGVPARKAGPHPLLVRENRLKAPMELTQRRLKKYFQDLQLEALRNLRGPKSALAGEVKALPSPEAPLYDQTSAQAKVEGLIRDGVKAAAQAAYEAASEDFGLDVSWDDEHPVVADFMGLRTAKIRGIDLTTQKSIVEALTASADGGETIQQAADRITEVFRGAIDNRSETIARSELIPAYGMASLRAYREGGVEKAQMYDGTGDAECADIDGKVVSLEEADQLLADEHPNGQRGVAPYMDFSEAEAAAFRFDRQGVAVA